MSQRKILFLIPTCVAPGGAQKLVDSISQLLSSEHDVNIASFDPPGSTSYFNSDIPFFPIGISIALPTPFRQIAYLWLAIKIKALKRTLGTEITFSILWQADLVNALSRSKNKRFSLAVINFRNNKTNMKMVKMRLFVGWIYRRFDEILAITPDVANEFMDFFGVEKSNISIFNNFIAKPDPVPIFSDDIGRFVVCGRFVFEKNIDGLLHVWSSYVSRNRGCQLVIIGDGPLFKEMMALANSLGLSVGVKPEDSHAEVLFVGSSVRPEDYMVGARAFLITSRHEGLPTVAIMAASLGLPIIGSDCHGGGMRHLFEISANMPLSDANDFDAELFGMILPIPDCSDPHTISSWINALELVDRDPIIREKLLLGAGKIADNHSLLVARKYWSSLIKRSFSF